MTLPVPSITQVNRAGKVVRSIMFGIDSASSPSAVDLGAFEAAIDTLTAWRAAHAAPLGKATMGLRSRVKTAGCSQIEVSQRLKRIPTIIDKLRREPQMELGRMADIGGCRAVLMDLDELNRVAARYCSPQRVVRVRDYIKDPKPDGYRAIHVYIKHDRRLMEVQLRTRVQHEWAYTVELVTARMGADVKNGEGPEPVQGWFAAVSRAMAIEEHGGQVPQQLLDEVSTLREQAQPYLRGGRP